MSLDFNASTWSCLKAFYNNLAFLLTVRCNTCTADESHCYIFDCRHILCSVVVPMCIFLITFNMQKDVK